ncbi:DNA-3-methyladenine glycosylase 1 [Ceratocystis fimbriata CBS 114723]|uniref:DNA-3-methyladenine glycosylase 1 n=1 Tax=Ceratocystis fimbriata CBS 114723 TaxID=1035309 RepID=A0A2C5X2E4_9PEZI|nr:DNA-3-methyladenine glycosylase 1 [Ceratocystis fimbriata CBS 114723]
MTTRRSARLASMLVDPVSKPACPISARSTNSRGALAVTKKRKSDVSETIPITRVSTEAPSSPPSFGDPDELPELPAPVTPRKKSKTHSLLITPSTRYLAASNLTSATLLSPETCRIVPPSSPSTVSRDFKIDRLSAKISNKDTLLSDALRHLVSVDARMAPLIDKHHCTIFSPEGLSETVDPWEGLVSSIISQQVSGAAARSIKQRFINLFQSTKDAEIRVEKEKGEKGTTANTSAKNGSPQAPFPAPSQVVKLDLGTLRGAGLSQRKAEYIHGLAGKFVSGELSAGFFAQASYDDLVERLTAVRGLGLWSVEMFACFVLRRPDVFSLGDLGVQRGMAAFEGRDVARLKSSGKGKWKYMSEKEMRDISQRFAPYRSIFMWYMWQVQNTDIEAMQGDANPTGKEKKAVNGSG